MIDKGYNHQTIQSLQQHNTMWDDLRTHYERQPPQPLQNIKPTQPKQQASPEDIERTKICVQNWHDQLSNKKIFHDIEANRLIIRIRDNTNNIYKSTISVYCASLSLKRKKPNYEPQWVYVDKEIYEKYHADIYLSCDPFTLQPEGFAMRDQLLLTKPSGKPDVCVYGIMRAELDRNIDQLFDLNYLLKNSQLESTQLESIIYV